MNKVLCPGQDTRFWRPQDVFDVTCSACGKEVEFFKDEARRRCPNCGKSITNPRLSTGCAQWCEHAAECLGFDPAAVESDGEEASLLDRLVDAVKSAVGEGSATLAEAVRSLENARRIAAASRKEAAFDRKLLFMAALLLPVIRNAREGQKAGESDPLQQILDTAGVDRRTAGELRQLLGEFESGDKSSTTEKVILSEALSPT